MQNALGLIFLTSLLAGPALADSAPTPILEQAEAPPMDLAVRIYRCVAAARMSFHVQNFFGDDTHTLSPAQSTALRACHRGSSFGPAACRMEECISFVPGEPGVRPEPIRAWPHP